MKIKIITSYKPGCWLTYAQKGIESMAREFPEDIDIVVYTEEAKQIFFYLLCYLIDLHDAEKNLVNFKNRHKSDPVANGKLESIPGGVTRLPELQELGGADKNNESFLIPQRIEDLEKFLLIVENKTKLNVNQISYISPLWTYKLLTYLSIFMIIGEIIAFTI